MATKTKAVAKVRPEKGPGSIAPETKAAILTLYETDPNKAKIARALNVSLSTVYKALGKTDPAEQRERRQESMARIAGKMAERVESLVDGLVIPKDASLQQRGVLMGIMADKIEKFDRRLEEAKREDVLDAVPIPETIEALAGALRNEIRSISFVLNLDVGAKVAEEAQALECEIGHKLIEAEVIETIDDVDGWKNG